VLATTLKTRKPVVNLTVSDLRAFPIWEFAIDEEGEAEQGLESQDAAATGAGEELQFSWIRSATKERGN
jgi:hypothetical protein